MMRDLTEMPRPRRRSMLAGGLALPMLGGGAAQAQQARDTLRIVFRDGVPNVDPYFNSQRTGLILAHQGWDCLVHRDPNDFSFKPLLATAWNWVDTTTIDFTLRQGVTFHNGDPFTADDVVYTFNTVANPETRTATPSNYSWIDRAEKTGDFSVRVHLKRPTPAALDYFSLVYPIWPKAYRERVGADGYARAPVGAGPYKITANNPGASIEFERHEGYYADSPKGKPAIRRLAVRFVPDAATELTELLSGRTDWIWNINPDQMPNLERLPNFRVARQESMRVGYMTIDSAGRTGAGNPLTKLPVRKAILHAIDRNAIATRLVQGGSRVPPAPCYPSQFGCDAEAAVQYEYDPNKAKALLAEAGFPNGFETEIISYVLPQWGSAVQNYLQAVGIRARLTQLQVAAAIQRSQEGRAPLYLGSWGSYSVNDVSSFMPTWFGGGGDDYFRDAETQRLLEEGGASNDEAVRRRAYSAAIRRVTEQAAFVPINTYVNTYGYIRNLEFQTWRDELPRFYWAKWR
jgi:peptide/nickel transport system substrate-binding protein